MNTYRWVTDKHGCRRPVRVTMHTWQANILVNERIHTVTLQAACIEDATVQAGTIRTQDFADTATVTAVVRSDTL